MTVRVRSPADAWWWLLLVVMAAAAAAVLRGDMDDSVSADSAFEVWADMVRDVDQCGLTLVRVSADEEMRLGRELAASGGWREVTASPWSGYVESVGADVAAHVRRRDIEYRFHVVDSPDVNAFALPGGQVFVTTGMLGFLESEAELAFVLGHEIAHVDQRHAIERLMTRLAMERIGLGEVGKMADLPLALVRGGYRKYHELEADTVGLHLGMAAGYEPAAAVAPFRRLEARRRTVRPLAASNPLSEAAGAVAVGLGSYLDSHPVTRDRIERLEQMIAHRRRWGRGTDGFRGVENFRQKVPRSVREIPDERGD
ncbi:MAG: M48 family metalloprotease [Planctomycetaceae bacterium]